MIINLNNTTAYAKLFDKANTLLELSGNDRIVDIYGYFNRLNEIITVAQNKGWDPKEVLRLTILPLDEPRLQVNADTREIKVPAIFKNLGIMGDHLAEIVFFEIDRYYDTTDFAVDDIKAEIEWTRNSADKESGITPCYVKLLSDDGRKVLIGWAISSELTEQSGNIEFALHLYQRDSSNNVKFSFNTLVAKANIGKTLNLEDATAESSFSDTILDRIKITSPAPTHPDNSYNVPIFVINIGDDETKYHRYTDDAGRNGFYADLVDGTITVVVDAEATNYDDTYLSYQYYKLDENGIFIQDGTPGHEDKDNPAGYSKELTSIGTYEVVIKEKMTDYKYSPAITSNILFILPPNEPKVRSYDIANEAQKYNPVIINSNNSISVSVLPEGEEFYDKSNDVNNVSTIGFDWYKNSTLSESGRTKITESSLENATTQLSNAEDDKFYFGTATVSRNGESITSAAATTYRATYAPILPASGDCVVMVNDTPSQDATPADKIQIIFTPSSSTGADKFKFDSLSYRWHYTNNPFASDSFEPKGEEFIPNDIGSGIIELPYKEKGAYKLELNVYRNGQAIESTEKNLYPLNGFISIRG